MQATGTVISKFYIECAPRRPEELVVELTIRRSVEYDGSNRDNAHSFQYA